ncbi:type VII secretion protein EccE [Mycolicibacterium lutetiense]
MSRRRPKPPSKAASTTGSVSTIGVDTRRITVLPAALLAIVIATIPVHGWPGYVAVTVGAAAVFGIAVITVGGFTAPQWVRRRLRVWRDTRKERPLRPEPATMVRFETDRGFEEAVCSTASSGPDRSIAVIHAVWALRVARHRDPEASVLDVVVSTVEHYSDSADATSVYSLSVNGIPASSEGDDDSIAVRSADSVTDAELVEHFGASPVRHARQRMAGVTATVMRSKDSAVVTLSLPPATTVAVGGEEIGVIWDGEQLICALDLHGRAHQPHWLRQRRVTTSATVPLDVLEAAIEALGEGKPCSVDITLDASRLTTTPYAGVYDTSLAGRPVAGARRTVLIARFAPAKAATYFAARTSLPTAAATSLVRLARALGAAGCPATPLTATDLDRLAQRSRSRGGQRWGYIAADTADGAVDSVYCIDPAALTDSRFPELWSVRTDSVMVTLRRDVRGRWSGFARVRGPRPLPDAPLPFLRALPGQQGAAATIGRPVPDTAPLTSVYEPVAQLEGLTIPAGPDGQVLGMNQVGDQLLIPLVPATDQLIAAQVHPIYAEQMILRAAATGARVTIISDDEARWSGLLGEGVRLATPGSELPGESMDLHVYDVGVPTPASPQNGTIQLIAPAPAHGGELDPFAGVRATVTLRQDLDAVTVTVPSGEPIVVRTAVDPAERPHLPSARNRQARTPVGAQR